MRHVNEPVPSLLERRPDCPLRLASLVESCLAKEPSARPASMADVVGEFETCLAELDSRPDGEATLIARSPVVRRSRPRRVRPARPGLRPALLVLLALAALAAAVAGIAFTRDGDPAASPGGGGGSEGRVQLAGVASYDPFGENRVEHPERVADATDGDPATYWTTETYESFTSTKEGVGLVLDVGEARELSSLGVVTDTPGFTAEIRAGEAEGGPFEQVVGASQTVGARTTWELEDANARFYLVWITALDGRARINEVTASS